MVDRWRAQIRHGTLAAMSDRLQSFEAFWPYYLQEHSKPVTRWMHWVGTNIAVAIVVTAVTAGPLWLLAAALVPGYAFAWVSHFFVEKNRPATFKYPLWSLIADFKMWALMWTGRLGPHLTRYAVA